MKIKDIMTRDLVIGNIDSTISEISKIMQQADIGFVPIADGNKIVGIITDRDIVIRALANNAESNTEVEKYMTTNIISIEQDKTIEDAINLMGKEQIKRLIITNNNKVVGILSLSDIINMDVNSNLVLENQKKIWEKSRNTDEYKTEIDDFYL
ncbi:MAG: CBS domain-containing protein [Mollicutes bacterium]|nr:CBS domain-containing protein [Mollicutes bacterium]